MHGGAYSRTAVMNLKFKNTCSPDFWTQWGEERVGPTERVAVTYMCAVCVCVCVYAQSCVVFAIPWAVARQAPLSMGFFRQEYWSGLPFPSPGDLPRPGIEPGSPALQADSLPAAPPGKPNIRSTICRIDSWGMLLYRPGGSARCRVMAERGGRRFKREGTCVSLWLLQDAVQQKLAQHCKQ